MSQGLKRASILQRGRAQRVLMIRWLPWALFYFSFSPQFNFPKIEMCPVCYHFTVLFSLWLGNGGILYSGAYFRLQSINWLKFWNWRIRKKGGAFLIRKRKIIYRVAIKESRIKGIWRGYSRVEDGKRYSLFSLSFSKSCFWRLFSIFWRGRPSPKRHTSRWFSPI